MKSKTVFAVDIGGSKLICGILTPHGEILDTYRADYAPGYTPELLFGLIKEGFERLNGASCAACGAAIPGLCDPKSGVWLYSPFSGISDIPVGNILSEMTGLPTYADNDVNVSALAERYFGVCRDTDDFLWVTVSNGIGGGLFLDGTLYRGARMTAGEIGHLIVEENGGSAGTANHFTCDFGKNAVKSQTDRPKIISLSSNIEVVTALGNDFCYGDIFLEQLKNLMNDGDVILLISASGNSENVVKAAEYVKSRNGKVIGFTGFGGGKLGKLSDIEINVPTDSYEEIEDVHLMLTHIIVCCFKSMKLGEGANA